ncbi:MULTISPECIES: GPP34 family phosphoprotein [Microbacterium]|uniref:GOLPH3/VPS74 family protein n=1 Tax=Microbacterium TaxID=33882 RepID=UPI000D651D00|nr:MULTISPECIES: GPP34 family phosphoprotein [Microbacterium]
MPNDINPSRDARAAASVAGIGSASSEPLLAEDLMLTLFQPESGTIAAENTLYYVLAGALLAELAERGGAEIEDRGMRGAIVRAAGDQPTDALLRTAWDYVAEKPREVQTVLAAVGPSLRAPVLDRLVARGDIRREVRKTLGFIPSTALELGSGRRADLVRAARAVLVDDAQPHPRTAALIALVSASGAMPVLHREIPWTTPTITRAKQFESGNWGAEAAAAAVTRTMTAVITNAIVAAAVLPHS